MAKRCYYDVLGVTRSARENEIKSAFRRLAKECHPDRCNGDPNAEKRFKELNEAYEALKDPQRRAAYDRYGHDAPATRRRLSLRLLSLKDRLRARTAAGSNRAEPRRG